MNTLSFKIVRENTAQILHNYRNAYFYYKYLVVKNPLSKANVDYMWNYYLNLRGLYEANLISVDCINRAYEMCFEIEKRGEHNGNK